MGVLVIGTMLFGVCIRATILGNSQIVLQGCKAVESHFQIGAHNSEPFKEAKGPY